MRTISLWMLAAILQLACSPSAQCQQYTFHPKNSISVSARYTQIVEENISPIVFSGPGLAVSFQKRVERDSHFQLLEVTGSAEIPKSTFENSHSSGVFSGIIQYSYLGSFKMENSTLSFGGFARLSITDAFYKNFDESRYYWANFYGIGALINYEIPITKDYAFEGIAAIPLYGVNFRPQKYRLYKIESTSFKDIVKSNNSNGTFGSLGNYLNPSVKLSLLTSRHSVVRSVSYKYEYLRQQINDASPFRESSHSLIIGIMLNK